MGVLTEMFVAREEEAKAYDHRCAERLQATRMKGLTSLEFETLWAILAGVELDPKVHALKQVSSTAETWTFQFPAQFINMLRALDPQATKAVATTWAATAEIASTAREMQPVLEETIAVAQSCAVPEQSVFLWVSL